VWQDLQLFGTQMIIYVGLKSKELASWKLYSCSAGFKQNVAHYYAVMYVESVNNLLRPVQISDIALHCVRSLKIQV